MLDALAPFRCGIRLDSPGLVCGIYRPATCGALVQRGSLVGDAIGGGAMTGTSADGTGDSVGPAEQVRVDLRLKAVLAGGWMPISLSTTAFG